MAYESIKVDIIPGAENAEVLHFSQYDNKRAFFIELFNGGAEFIPEAGMSLSLECRKRDGNIVIISDPVLTDNVAEFSTTEQLTACYGDNEAEIKIVDDNDLVIGSANFIINVEKSPACGGLTSESEIDNLTQQIEDITQQVIGDDYYNKTQTDALLADKADVSDLPDMSHYYTKQQTDNLLDDKADVSDLPDMSQYYTKQQTDNLLNNILPVGTASGNPCNFNTAIAAPLQALTANITASGGGGTPTTPIPIVGHSALNLDVNGNTFTVSFGQTVYGGVYDAIAGKVRITSVDIYLGSLDYTYQSNLQRFYSNTALPNIGGEIKETNFYKNVICEIYENSTSTANNTFFVLTSNGVIYIYDDRYTSASDFKMAMSGIKCIYELATPIEINVSELSVAAIVGLNNITSDCGGDVTVSYKDSIQHYIDSRL